MSSQNRITQTLYALTTRIFRCHGLAPQTTRADRFSALDFAVLLSAGLLLAGWYLFHFEPQRERSALLASRLVVLGVQVKAEEQELRRLRREIGLLEQGQPQAWERAARTRLGWLRPGEVVEVAGWKSPAGAPRAGSPAGVLRRPGTRAAAVAPPPAHPILDRQPAVASATTPR